MINKFKMAIAVVMIAVSLVAFKPNEHYFEIAKNLEIFATLYKEVNRYYVDDVNPTTLINSGIESMLSTLDPYTNYIPEDQIEDYRTMTTGEYGGIGSMISSREGKIIVVMPNENYPAHKAGLLIGDEILEIDGVVVTGKDVEDISKLLKGQANTPIKLKIRRIDKDKPFEVNLQREKIRINNVPYSGMVSQDIGLIQLSDFTRDASREVKNALNELKEKGAKKIILDLRGNPGGLLSEAINIANLFLPKGVEIVSTKGKITEWNKSHESLNQPADLEIPIAVLVNNHSASASEIVSGVIQDYDRGVLIGKRTFGKGLVQATRPLSYNSKLKVTVAKYYIPSGRCIQEIDYSVRNPDGSPAKLPDSLRNEFKTKNGRPVYDGGGITPDIIVEDKKLSSLTVALLEKWLIFDYATEYRSKTPQISSLKEFKLTDKDYDSFVKWLKTKQYDYVTPTEKTLNELIETSKKENTYAHLQDEINLLKEKISKEKENDFIKYKDEILHLLSEEIISRYYWQKGKFEASFQHDSEVKEAISLLNDKEKYQKILSNK
jgi:carboxyl-terminal processing protease